MMLTSQINIPRKVAVKYPKKIRETIIVIGVNFIVTIPIVCESEREKQISELVFWTVNNFDED